MISTGRIKSSSVLIFGLMETANAADTTNSAGPRTRIRSAIMTTICSMVISFVSLVVKDAVEKVSIFLKENVLIFL